MNTRDLLLTNAKDRYDELKDYILMRKSDYERYIKILQEDISTATFDNPEDLGTLHELADNFKYCCQELESINRKLRVFMDSEYKIRKMLYGFCECFSCDIGHALLSFVYSSIDLITDENYSAQVGYKFFNTIEEAKAYSIALGENEHWLNIAYEWL